MRVMAHGCFDILHIGHIRLLKYARSLGDELIVTVLSDKYVRLYKGEGRPIHTADERVEQLLAMRCVNSVLVVDGPGHETVETMISALRPKIYVKGREYEGRIPEQAFLDSIGIKVAFFDMVKGRSTTKMVEVCG